MVNIAVKLLLAVASGAAYEAGRKIANKLEHKWKEAK